MQILNCERCGRPQEKDESVSSFVCGRCTCVSVAEAQHAEEERLGVYTPEAGKAARRAKRWTQKTLAFKLGITPGVISAFECGSALIHSRHAKWLDKQ